MVKTIDIVAYPITSFHSILQFCLLSENSISCTVLQKTYFNATQNPKRGYGPGSGIVTCPLHLTVHAVALLLTLIEKVKNESEKTGIFLEAITISQHYYIQLINNEKTLKK